MGRVLPPRIRRRLELTFPKHTNATRFLFVNEIADILKWWDCDRVEIAGSSVWFSRLCAPFWGPFRLLMLPLGVSSGKISVEGQVPHLIVIYELGFLYEVIVFALFIALAICYWWVALEPAIVFLVLILAVPAWLLAAGLYLVHWFDRRLKQAVHGWS